MKTLEIIGAGAYYFKAAVMGIIDFTHKLEAGDDVAIFVTCIIVLSIILIGYGLKAVRDLTNRVK